MKETIYIDVLILLNIYVSYFLFACTKKILGVSVSNLRMIIACLVSGAYSLLILFNINFIEFTLIKIAMGLSLSAIAFFNKRIRFFVKATLVFFLVNFIFGGLMFCLWYFITPASMQYKNGVVYFNISALAIAIFTIIAYLIITAFTYFLNKRNQTKDCYYVILSLDGRETMISALLDTGNKLTDAFTGLPIMVCELTELKSLLPKRLYAYFESPQEALLDKEDTYLISKKIRMIPVSVVSGTGCLMAFKPDKITLVHKQKKMETNALVAVTTQKLSDGDFQALISTAMLCNVESIGNSNKNKGNEKSVETAITSKMKF
ncbi:sigma-E processing peptidase SpoIIGA [Paludicola sp. MB14-C6]|uniref:sigma-E processing peptidase SpoIIGA n=1 Tax=Paludihabitans sp. MB14-C6 TaxID=3070656 RepID=UPI0027DE1007|nr:sigma-E processing peptidase SpoIIGA [Paludicola sp. MB14-C6]WMJ23600.1 sigma-E processing peptidase SpoIIGA [Paludicola sp. MB14-C6]